MVVDTSTGDTGFSRKKRGREWDKQSNPNIIQTLHFDSLHPVVVFYPHLDLVVMSASDPAVEWDMFDVWLALNNSFCIAAPSFEISRTFNVH